MYLKNKMQTAIS
jgi:hypothetical protein